MSYSVTLIGDICAYYMCITYYFLPSICVCLVSGAPIRRLSAIVGSLPRHSVLSLMFSASDFSPHFGRNLYLCFQSILNVERICLRLQEHLASLSRPLVFHRCPAVAPVTSACVSGAAFCLISWPLSVSESLAHLPLRESLPSITLVCPFAVPSSLPSALAALSWPWGRAWARVCGGRLLSPGTVGLLGLGRLPLHLSPALLRRSPSGNLWEPLTCSDVPGPVLSSLHQVGSSAFASQEGPHEGQSFGSQAAASAPPMRLNLARWGPCLCSSLSRHTPRTGQASGTDAADSRTHALIRSSHAYGVLPAPGAVPGLAAVGCKRRHLCSAEAHRW